MVESVCAEDVTGLKLSTEATDAYVSMRGRGAFCKSVKVT